MLSQKNHHLREHNIPHSRLHKTALEPSQCTYPILASILGNLISALGGPVNFNQTLFAELTNNGALPDGWAIWWVRQVNGFKCQYSTHCMASLELTWLYVAVCLFNKVLWYWYHSVLYKIPHHRHNLYPAPLLFVVVLTTLITTPSLLLRRGCFLCLLWETFTWRRFLL